MITQKKLSAEFCFKIRNVEECQLLTWSCDNTILHRLTQQGGEYGGEVQQNLQVVIKIIYLEYRTKTSQSNNYEVIQL
jgi:hypothetical protein